MNKFLLPGIFVTLLVIAFFLGRIVFSRSEITEEKVAEKITSATYSCANAKKIQAVFFEDKVELMLSDARSLLLLHAMSGSGARYTNTDQSFVFWNKGNTAFIEERAKVTFKDCVEDVASTQ
jgi:membrane-bound inhibitor of C-type lysozyme